MKIPSWMRVRTKQKSKDPLKEFVTGNYSVCLHSNSDQNTRFLTLPSHVHRLNPFPESDCHEDEEKLEEDEASFRGFLAIGTLGADPPATPRLFDASLEEEEDGCREKKEGVTEDELKHISDKLEKFIESEAEQGCNGSILRQSNLSGLREFSGNASFKIEEPDAEEYGEPVLCPLQGYLLGSSKLVMCPLQGYLLGSSIELPRTNDEAQKRKGLIAELLQRKKPVEEVSFCERHERKRRDSIKKKMLRKLHGSPKNSFTPCSKDDDTVSTKTKLKKIGQIFRRKIHPVIYTAESEDNKPNKDHDLDNVLGNRSYINADLTYRHEEDHDVWSSSGGFLSSGSSSDMPQYEVVGKSPNGKTEKWIKTDAEYLVLEL